MDVTVDKDKKSFDFDPGCDFSFNDSFTTSKGVECTVDAGMCSGFSPEESFEVRCDDLESSSISIKCPKED